MVLILKLIFSALLSGTVAQSNYDFGDCQPVYTRDYGYSMYFHIPRSAVIRNDSVLFYFSVEAVSDAHVVFSPIAHPKDGDPVYEIVLGGGANTFSDIRRLHKKPFRKTLATLGILNKFALRNFWIKIDKGTISVGEGDSSKPRLLYYDSDQLSLQYMAFSSWWGTSAKWYFDCMGTSAVPGNNTASGRLAKDLLVKYNPYVAPVIDDDFVLVNPFLVMNYIDLDPSRSVMEVKGKLRMDWEDPRLQWTPEKYDHINFLKFTDKKVWQPSLVLNNGAAPHQSWCDDGIVKVDHEGTVVWVTSVHFITRCNIKMDTWPNDQHTCQIEMGFDSSQQDIYITKFRDLSLGDGMNIGLWELLSVEGKVEIVQKDRRLTGVETKDNKSQSVLNITISVGRHSSTYYYSFNLPLKVTILISVISFCLPYSCPQRVIVQVIVLLMYIVNLLSVSSVLPSAIKETPSIISLNCGAFMVAVISTMLTVWLMQLSHSGKELSIPKIQFLDNLVDFFTLHFNNFHNNGKRGQKLMNLEDDEDVGKTPVADQKHSEAVGTCRRQAFLTVLDIILLATVISSYLLIIVIF